MNKRVVVFDGSGKDELQEGLDVFLSKHNFTLDGESDSPYLHLTGIPWEESCLKVVKSGNQCKIFYKERVHFFRGVSWLLQNSSQNKWEIQEKVNFNSNGIMLDCSRNGVPTVETIKKFICRLAQFGMNRFYLYMEDTLEIEGYPYWGYMRGRYSKEEMQECDSYAALFGITLVPCIQTLAHLKTALNLPAFSGYKDIDDILLLEDEKVKELIGGLLSSVSECFSGRIVHLGMDEAGHLGRGKYMDLHGPSSPSELMKRHMQWLMEECEKRHLKPIIWSDMYLRLNFHAQGYYSIEEGAQPQNEEHLSKDIGLCYWDYYHEDRAFYNRYIKLHQKLGNPLLFAGGAWTWNGIAPNVSKAFKTTCDALDECLALEVKDVFMTVWMDNGAETPLETALPTLALFGEYGFGSRPDQERIIQRFRFCFQKNFQDYFLLDAFDNLQYGELKKENLTALSMHNQYSINPSKTLLYQDSMIGLFEKMYKEDELAGQYSWLAEKLEGIMGEDDADKDLFGYYFTLARLLSCKAGIAGRLRRAYAQADRAQLEEIADKELERIGTLAQELADLREAIWMNEYKPFGYETLDIRLAGVERRSKSAARRIKEFLSGVRSSLPELEEEILLYKTPEMMEGVMERGFNLWERIVSCSNIEGV
ncbi:MAG: beta-N-acetylhexosaminidase [Lachnospiraceae bacterium]|nr:beta-N-acetylhexosaminidase [Lachnospiraceae bacterium]